ncbi:MAG: hypothetical protein AB7T49_18640 [Oligoflexales bacterium]
MRLLIYSLFSLALSSSLFGQDDYSGDFEVRDVEPEPSGSSGNSGLQKKAVPTTMKDDWKPPPRKTYTAAERLAECRKYEGKLLGYYEFIYKIENCKRREIRDQDYLNGILKGNQKVINVENDTIGKLRVGKPIESPPKKAAFSCNRVNNSYVISQTNDIFYVENCKKRAFPDYDTYETHKHDKKSSQVLVELSPAELKSLTDGTPFPSVLNKPAESASEEILEIIPLHEACRGIDGRYASYFSKLYKIEKCHKREIANPEGFLFENRAKKIDVVELNSDQWLSLPEGKTIDDTKKEPEQEKELDE